jgi:hypothetical protein
LTSREKKNAHKNLSGNPEGKSPFRRSRRSYEDNIKIDLGNV